MLRANFIVLVFFFLLSSCGKNPKAAIATTWKLVEIQSPNMGKVVSKLDTEEERQRYQKMMRGLIEKSEFVFKANGSYEIKIYIMGASETTQGTWEIDEEGKILTLKETGSNPQERKFKMSYDQEKLILSDDKGEQTTKVVLIPA